VAAPIGIDLQNPITLILWGSMKPRRRETVHVVNDDSGKRKRGKHMEAVGWIRDAATGKSVRGHLHVAAILEFRGVTIPWGVRKASSTSVSFM